MSDQSSHTTLRGRWYSQVILQQKGSPAHLCLLIFLAVKHSYMKEGEEDHVFWTYWRTDNFSEAPADRGSALLNRSVLLAEASRNS